MSSDATQVCVGPVNEDGDFSILARVCAFDGSGALSPITDEGNLCKRADFSSITVKIFNISGDNPNVPEQTATPSPLVVMFDTLQTTGIWGRLKTAGAVVVGGNFKYDVPASWVPLGRAKYRLEVIFLTTSGKTYFGKWQPETQEIISS